MREKGYIIRPAQPDDLHFVIRTWIDSYKTSKTSGILSISDFSLRCECGRGIPYDYQAVMEAQIRRILGVPGVEVLVAWNPDALPPNDLHAFIVYERNPQIPRYKPPHYRLERITSSSTCVHYVLVKKIYRGFGIARDLFHAAKVDPSKHFLYTCTTPISVQIAHAGKIPKAEWDPLCARFEKETSSVHDQAGRQAPLQPARAPSSSSERTVGHLQERRRGQ